MESNANLHICKHKYYEDIYDQVSWNFNLSMIMISSLGEMNTVTSKGRTVVNDTKPSGEVGVVCRVGCARVSCKREEYPGNGSKPYGCHREVGSEWAVTTCSCIGVVSLMRKTICSSWLPSVTFWHLKINGSSATNLHQWKNAFLQDQKAIPRIMEDYFLYTVSPFPWGACSVLSYPLGEKPFSDT